MIHINPARRELRTINATVHGAPEMKNYLGTRVWQPDVIEATYARINGGEWMLRQIELVGPRLLKNGISDHERLDERWFFTIRKHQSGLHTPVDESPSDSVFLIDRLPDWASDWANKNIPTE